MAIKVYADAGSNLFSDIVKMKNLDITVVPMNLYVGDKLYRCYEDKIDINKFSKSFYQDMKDGKEVRTSLINPNDFYELFIKDVKNGHQVFCFTMAKGISGTYQSACIARDMVNDEVGKEMVYVCDSATAGFGEGLQAIHIARLAKKGMSFEDLQKEAETYKFRVRSEFTVDDVRYLVKTGRVSKTAARIANILRIKVLLKGSDESKIVLTGKVPGRLLAIRKLANQVVEHIVHPDKHTIYITHCDCYKDAYKLAELLHKQGLYNIEIYPYDVVTGAHIGPNSLAIFYVGNNRDLPSDKKEKEKDEK